MGAWAADPFGNDTACDWNDEFLATPGLEKVWESIQEVLNCEDYLDSDAAQRCLAACEVIARLNGGWGLKNSYSEAIDNWVVANPMSVPEILKSAADSAITRILGDDSELQELWDEDGHNEEWHREIEGLRSRIR